MKRIKISASVSYDVIIDKNILKDTGSLVKDVIAPCKACIVTDDTVNGLYADTVEHSLIERGFEVIKFVFPHGERSKSTVVLVELLEFLHLISIFAYLR